MDTHITSDVFRQGWTSNSSRDESSYASELVDVDITSTGRLGEFVVVLIAYILYTVISCWLLLTVYSILQGNISNKDELLPPKNIYIDQAVLHWDVVPNVDEYRVNVLGNNANIIVNNNYIILHSLVSGKKYVMNIQSVMDGQLSPNSENIEYIFYDPTLPNATILDTPHLQLASQHYLAWNEVPNAAAYSLYCNSVEIAQVQGSYVNIIQYINGKYVFEIRALSEDINYTHSNLSNSVSTDTSHPSYDLDVPKVSIVGSKAVWGAVENATSYDVLLSGSKSVINDIYPQYNSSSSKQGIDRYDASGLRYNVMARDTGSMLDDNWVKVTVRARNAFNASDWSAPVYYEIIVPA